jgi:2-oxo-4-hydroxy-4-carboxy-5-ureidoimidazoline decarboxylase
MSMPPTSLDALPVPQARQDLLSCCASPQWADLLIAGRPFKDLPALRAASDDAIARLPWEQVLLALDAHPRIGERSRAAGREAAWSSTEQAAATPQDAATAAALVRANVDYEQRFGHVFLICATGLSAAEILSAARSRLGNQPQVEQECVRRELAAIAGLRLSRLVSS